MFRRDRRKVAGRDSDRGSLQLLAVVLFVSIFAAWWLAFRLPQAGMPAPPAPLLAAGVAAMWAGMAFRLWSILTLGAFFRTTVIVQDEHRLVERGPYARLRHPSYAGGMLTLLGLGLALGNWVSLLLLTVPPALAYRRRIAVEEQALAARFGQAYGEYERRTWAVVPFLW